MEQKTKKFYVFLPWVLILAILGAFALFGYNSKMNSNLLESRHIKVNLLSTIRIHLLEAIEDEKNAVLAISDQESEKFATQARQATDQVENSRKEIESIILQERRQPEIEMINEFNVCWSQLRKLDDTILNLATQNTNLKAQKISATECALEMANFEENLQHLMHRNTNDKQCNETDMLSYEALTAGLKVFVLHKPHIEEADDVKMDIIERNIKSYDESARKALASLRKIAGFKENEDLNHAETAYNRFMDLTAEVLRLSRMNTNIKSAALSLGNKRLISSECQRILAALQETVQEQQFKATR